MTSSDRLVEAAPVGLTRAGAIRLDPIDMMRGLVIAIMALDHVREFFHVSAGRFDPTDPLKTTPVLFATRWVTHLCAPTFVFLAGVSILLQKANGKTPSELTRLLITRGVWLVLLECTVVSFGFNFGGLFVFLQVIWAIGLSMICMSLIARMSAPLTLAAGMAILLLYPLALPLTADATGGLGIVRMLTIGGPGKVPGAPIAASYPALPWLGVMCIGFGLGPVFRMPAAARTRVLLPIAIGLLAAFVALRALNGYGNPAPWVGEPTATQTALSFLNVSKYPPSPDFVCATLGVSILLFIVLGWLRGPVARVLLDFGRTPLFTYVTHVYIAHGLMLLAGLALGTPGAALNYLSTVFSGALPPAWGFSLPVVYLVWALVVAMLVPPSRWFASVKRRRRDWWLSCL